ncbi:MAG: DUF3307 domain-containing protein [Actinomycetota bacterium]|nr:DUF3307 domain-containing protein [Actinomycetota bacterium]
MPTWVEIFVLFVVSHLVGDYLLQTDWQAVNKRGGLTAGGASRRALLAHVATYTLAFVPVLAWIADDIGAAVLGLAAIIAVPHLIQDDGRLLTRYIERVKGADDAPPRIFLTVDQTFHTVALLLTALLAVELT